jgi:hypothetical protein
LIGSSNVEFKRDLTASRATVAIFVLINAAALVRVCASWHTDFMALLLLVAGAGLSSAGASLASQPAMAG